MSNEKKVCAWCGREMLFDDGEVTMGDVVANHDNLDNVSHGICPKCKIKAQKRFDKFSEWIIRRMSRID